MKEKNTIKQQIKDDFSLYLTQIRKIPLLNKKEEIDLLKKISQGDEKAKKNFITANLKLVISIARRYVNKGLPLMDLIEEGNIALIKSTEKFDYKKGYRFSTFATYVIKQAMVKALIQQGLVIQIPSFFNQYINQYLEFVNIYLQEYGEEPSVKEVSKQLELTEEKVLKIMEIILPSYSLDHSNFNSNKKNKLVQEIMKNLPEINPEKETIHKLQHSTLMSFLDLLKEQEQIIITYRYGLDGEKIKTLEEIGQQFGLTRERIRQIAESGLRKLKILITNASSEKII